MSDNSTTTQDLFNALLRIDYDQVIEVACDEQTKEALRIALVRMLARYKDNARGLMDADQLPQSLRCDWKLPADAIDGVGIAKFSIGKKRSRSRPVNFVIRPADESASAANADAGLDPLNPALLRGDYERF